MKANKNDKATVVPAKKTAKSKTINLRKAMRPLFNAMSAEPVKLAAILFIITATIAAALAYVYEMTYDDIVAQKESLRQEALKQVMPDADSFEAVDIYSLNLPAEINSIDAALKTGEKIGYCVSVSTVGYGGQIQLMVGVDLSGKITTFKIVSMNETPGLGSKAKEPPFASAFDGLAYPISVVKGKPSNSNEVSAISGATVTSRAVTNGINIALEAVNSIIESSDTEETVSTEENTEATGENATAENVTAENGGE